MIYRIILLVALNAADVGVTQAATKSDSLVGEANPIINHIIANFGWGGAWAYKLFAPLCLGLFVWAIFREPKRRRILNVVNVVFFAVVVYNLLLWAASTSETFLEIIAAGS
jgi:hypothetical protein